VKPAVESGEHEVLDLMDRTRHFVATRQRQLFMTSLAIGLVAIVVIGYSVYASGVKDRAANHLYEGYKYYHGLFGTDPLVKTDRLARAVESFDASFNTSPSPAALYYKGAALDALGRDDEAIAALNDFIARFGGEPFYSPLAEYKLAMVLARKGRTDEALKTLDTLSSRGSTSLDDLALVESARILRSLGQDDAARGMYQTVVNKYPASAFIGEATAMTRPAGIANETSSPSAPATAPSFIEAITNPDK
jgi:TolA-binding protein